MLKLKSTTVEPGLRIAWIRAELNLSANVENGIIIFFVVPANTGSAALPGRPAGPGHGPLDYVVHNRNREREREALLTNR